MRLRSCHLFVALATVGLSWSAACADVEPNHLFSSNAVLQQGQKIPVWGKADDGEKVTVTIEGEGIEKQEKSTTAEGGKWRVDLDAMKAGGPYKLTIAGKNTIELENVMVGEVWLCSGQSNMEWPIKASHEPEKVAAGADRPMIRLIKVPKQGANVPQDDFQGEWKVSTPENVPEFSAVAYHFGCNLHENLDVPIGLISSNFGGSPAEAWATQESMSADEEIAAASKKLGFFGAGALYNGMIHPLAPYPIRGVIWYQGESNASRANKYEKLMTMLINDWRKLWNSPELPFLTVQLAPWDHGKGTWAALREAQVKTAENVPNTAMVVIVDVGDKDDIHPKQKQPVGERLALAARAMAYGEDVEYKGPTFKEMTIEDGKAILTFDNVAGGLKIKEGDKLKGFKIAGKDKKFVDAEANIEGTNKIIVSSPDVNEPVAVRYGWEDFPQLDLWNGAGLPASPFRTDDFPLNGEASN